MKELLGRNKGITLIALIITIIVMLILTGVALNTLTGKGSIIENANSTVGKYNNSVEQEQIGLNAVSNYLDEKVNKTSYIGYYADFTGDGEIEGIIFVDLASDGSGTWNSSDQWSSYTYTAKSKLKEYYVSKIDYEGIFGKADVLTPVSGTTGNDRFYVMALNDITTDSYNTFYWYYSAILDSTYNVSGTVSDFGQGKANTIRMKVANDAGTYGTKNTQDLWQLWTSGGSIKSTADNKTYYMVTDEKDSQKWFVPSKSEWSAFGNYLYTKVGITASEYGKYGLSDWYWSSSQALVNRAFLVHFLSGQIGRGSFEECGSVRYCATF